MHQISEHTMRSSIGKSEISNSNDTPTTSSSYNSMIRSSNQRNSLLLNSSSMFFFPKLCLVPDPTKIYILIVIKIWDKECNEILFKMIQYLSTQKDTMILVQEQNLKQMSKSHSEFLQQHIMQVGSFNKDQCESKVDLIITIGGDGTILYASNLFQNKQVPPIISFKKQQAQTYMQGTLGFLCIYQLENLETQLDSILGKVRQKDQLQIQERMRLFGIFQKSEISTPKFITILNADQETQSLKDETQLPFLQLNKSISLQILSPQNSKHPKLEQFPQIVQLQLTDILSKYDKDLLLQALQQLDMPQMTNQMHTLNQFVIHRGNQPGCLNLEIFINDEFIVNIIGDGLIISTPTGSTAYNLSSNGPVMQNSVRSISITPICPLSLSFRTLILPEDIQLQIKLNSQSSVVGYVSGDGIYFGNLSNQEEFQIEQSSYDMCLVRENQKDQTSDWMEKIQMLLHWNSSYDMKKQPDIDHTQNNQEENQITATN